MKLKPSSILLLVAAVAAFVLFFILKCLHLQRCDYTSDMFSHFQLSHDWLIGKPLFYENCFGFHAKLHNYFIDLLLSPFTALFGVYGLFVALFSLIIASFFMALNMLDRRAASFETRLLLFIFYASPLSFFIFHNEHYGFHVEMLLVPLSLLLCVAYLQKSKWYLLWTALIVLVKEDAVIVLWCCLMVIHVKDWNVKQLTPKQFFRKALNLTLLCLLIFIVGLVWLKYLNHWETTRSGEIIARLQGRSLASVMNSFGYLILQRALLTLPVAFIVFLCTGWRFTLSAMLISIPILIVNLLAGMMYFSDGDSGMYNVFSLLWVPRLSMHWGYWLSVLVISLTCQSPFRMFSSRFARVSSCACFGLLLFGFQYWFLLHCEVTRFDAVKSIREAFEPAFPNEANWELAAAARIAPQLPPHYPVAPMDGVFGAFHKQDIVWINMLDNAYYKPRMVLASYNKEYLPPDMTTVMKHPLFMLYKEKLHIYVEAEDSSYI
jgi:ABC-type multidrug transport system fused ATPase/permease subunit